MRRSTYVLIRIRREHPGLNDGATFMGLNGRGRVINLYNFNRFSLVTIERFKISIPAVTCPVTKPASHLELAITRCNMLTHYITNINTTRTSGPSKSPSHSSPRTWGWYDCFKERGLCSPLPIPCTYIHVYMYYVAPFPRPVSDLTLLSRFTQRSRPLPQLGSLLWRERQGVNTSTKHPRGFFAPVRSFQVTSLGWSLIRN